jgi:hypothetical protein
MLLGEGAGKHKAKEVGMVPYIKGQNRDRSGDVPSRKRPDNPN